jgi:CMP-N,N'-diacetyllegionaminic acid synthase
MKVYAIIPARAGSKGVKNKNIQLLKGKPLISYSIEAALKSKALDRVIVTTDSPEIAEISKLAGAEVPFLRPSEFAQDKSPDRAYIEHALSWFKENEDVEPDFLVLLRPTTPWRDTNLIDLAVSKMIEHADEASSLRSVHALAEPPQKMLKIEDKWLTGFFPDDKRPDYFNLPRQMFPTAYQPNGYIDIVKSSYLAQEKERIFGSKILGFETPYSVEIDTESEFDYLEYLMEKKYV